MNDAVRLELPMVGPPGHDPFWDDKKRTILYYDRRGNPISFRDWGRLNQFGGRDYQVVRQEEVGPYFVSTVWLGLDHSFLGGPPMIFETMVFKGEESDLDCRRYSTEEEALAGHVTMVAEVRLILDATEGL